MLFKIKEREELQNRITELEARDRDRKIELEARELVNEQLSNRIAELQNQLAEQYQYRLEQLVKELTAKRDEIADERRQHERAAAELYEGPLFFSLTTGKERDIRWEHYRKLIEILTESCLLYTSPSPRD